MVWLFGYGSLLWKTNFNYKTRVVGYVKGFKRRFWWWSLDHRGVPGAPGRVVNLLPSEDPEERVWGVAYEISDGEWRETVGPAMDHRERGGYTQRTARVYWDDESDHEPLIAVLYIGSPDDKQYAGPDSIQAMAKTISVSEGPSGTNREYLFNLASSLRSLCGKVDPHVCELETAVRNIIRDQEES